MVGSINDKYGTEVVAYQYGETVTLDYLNSYVNPESRVDLSKPFRPTQVSKIEAAEKFPEWYDRKIRRKMDKPPKWDISGKVHGKDPYALYHWWMRQVDKVQGGHRYFFMMNMAIYACKCSVPKKVLEKDMSDIYEILRKIPHINEHGQQDELNEQDIHIAMKAYSKDYYCFKLSDHIATSGIDIKPNRRNHRTQEAHIKIMNFVRDEVMGKKDWRNKNGRPKGSGTFKDEIALWRAAHPEGTPKECIESTGISKNTVYKWWKESLPEVKRIRFNPEDMTTPDFIFIDSDGRPIIPEGVVVETLEETSNKERLSAYERGLLKYLGKYKEDNDDT